MLGVKLVAKLCDMPRDVTITAFDSCLTDIFVGTDSGVVQKFSVSIEDDSTNIFTTFVKEEQVSEKKKISRLRHSPSHESPLLFVLSARRLLVMDSRDLTKYRTLSTGTGAFCVSIVGASAFAAGGNFMAASATAPTFSQQQQATPEKEQQEQATSSADNKQQGKDAASSSPGGSPKSKLSFPKHRIVACDKQGKDVVVYHLTPGRRDTEPVHVLQVQQLLMPEPVVSLTEHKGILCVGLNREYSMISIQDGDAKPVLALNGKTPMVVYAHGEAYLRLHNIVFVVSIRSMPTGASGQALNRTIPFQAEPATLTVKHPYVFAFNDESCEVYSIYEDEVIERLPVTDCLFTSSCVGSSDVLFCAGKRRIWLMQIHPLASQIHDLVERYKVEDAFHLVQFYQHEWTQEREIELHIMAGFAHLWHNKCCQALSHFNEHVDVREILCLIPELIPPRDLTTMPGSTKNDEEDDEEEYWRGWESQCEYNVVARTRSTLTDRWTEAFHEFYGEQKRGQPTDDTGGAGGGGQAIPRIEHEGQMLTLHQFIEYGWSTLKDELVEWLKQRRQYSTMHQRRSIEAALTILFLHRGDERSLYRLITSERSTRISDVEPELRKFNQQRVLATLYTRKGHAEQPRRILEQHLSYRYLYQQNLKECQEKVRALFPFLASIELEQQQQQQQQNDSNSSNTSSSIIVDDTHEIFFAVESCNVAYVHDVLREDASCIHVRDSVGHNTPLHHAVFLLGVLGTECQPVLAVLAHLVDSGANICAANADGASPIDVCLALSEAVTQPGSCDVALGLLVATCEVAIYANDFGNKRCCVVGSGGCDDEASDGSNSSNNKSGGGQKELRCGVQGYPSQGCGYGSWNGMIGIGT